MIRLDFQGWFQCRLATDPDPTDEPRGVSGWTFALAGEPDLDRVIHTVPGAGVVQRRFAPEIGVRVAAVHVDGSPRAPHPLVGAPCELLGKPVFEGRNGLASEDTEEPIYPFHIRISVGAVVIERESRDLATGEWKFQRSAGTSIRPDALIRAGITDPKAYLEKRRRDLEEALLVETDELEKLRLETRLEHLSRRGLGPVPLGVGLDYHHVLDGPWATFRDPRGVLGVDIDASPWIAKLWVGCWDADLLVGYMQGSLTCGT